MNILNIISNTPVSSLAIPSIGVTHNTMGRLDVKYPVILVDTSYWLYYRFFALRIWYKKTYPDACSSDNYDMEHNWLEDSIFMTKFRKLFIEHIIKLVRKYKSIMTNVVFCIDCSYKDIWRNSLTTNYKATRPESLKKKGFNSFNVFSYMKKEYLPELQLQYGIKILYHQKCEADDVIGNFAPFLLSNNFPMVYIIANDNDYLQICNPQIRMVKGDIHMQNTSSIPSLVSCGEKYLIRKILLGDVSDNISSCNVNKLLLERHIENIKQMNRILDDNVFKKVSKVNIDLLLNNDEQYIFFKELLEAIRSGDIKNASDSRLALIRNFYENTVLMDFKMLPLELQKELHTRFTSYL